MESTQDKAHPLRHPPPQDGTEAAPVVAEAAVVTVAAVVAVAQFGLSLNRLREMEL